MEQHEPLHSDRHKSSLNITLIIAVGVALVGLYIDILWFLAGVVMAAFSWFTTPSQYVIFSDRLLIAYGRPRVRQVLFQQINQVELLKLAIGDRLRVRLTRGGSLYLQPRDADEFQSRLQSALSSYHPPQQEGELEQQS